MKTRKREQAFTVVELMISVLAVVLVMAIAFLLLGRTKNHTNHISDSTYVRAIHQGMALWSQSNKDVYPLPSLVDLNNDTVPEEGDAKNTTANIISLLIYNGFFGPELCVTNAEVNPSVKVMSGYHYGEATTGPPTAALNPAKALWDPAFSTDYSGGKTGNFSYAHMLPADARRKLNWINNFDAHTAAVGNRGPEMKGTGSGPGGERLYVGAAGSNTYLIHGPKTSWEGNIAYNDNHVDFETRWDPRATTYKDAAGKTWTDCLFYDEPDDPSGRNNYLGNFTKAGGTGSEFRAIWD